MKLRIIYLVALAFMGHTNAYAKSSSAVGLAIRVETDQAGTTPDAQLVVRIDGTDDLRLLPDDGALASDTPGDG